MNTKIILAVSVVLAGGVASAAPRDRGRLGIRAIEISPELRAHFGAPKDRGVLVDGVLPDSPAARAGVQVGDLVLEVDGDATSSASDVLQALTDRKKADVVDIEVLRGKAKIKVDAKLDTDPMPLQNSFRWMDRDFGPGDNDTDLRHMLDDLRERLDKLEQQQPRTRT